MTKEINTSNLLAEYLPISDNVSYDEFIVLNPLIMDDSGKNSASKFAHILQGEFLKTHTFIFDTIDERMAEIIKYRCGLYDGSIWTLQQVGDKLNISRERVNQLERLGFDKLRSYNRIKLMMQYDDSTFDKSLLANFSDEFKSLIRQDIVNNIQTSALNLIEDTPIKDMHIRHWQNKQSEDEIKSSLALNNIHTCKDFILYVQSHKDISGLGLNLTSYRALLYSICDLIDSKSAIETSKELLDYCIKYKFGEDANLTPDKIFRKARNRVRAMEYKQQKAELHKQILALYPDFSLSSLNLVNRTQNALYRNKITTFYKLIEYYFKYDNLDIPYLGPKSQVNILEELISIGIECDLSKLKITGVTKINQNTK